MKGSCRGLDGWEWLLEAIRLGYSPMGTNPRVMDGIGGFKVWAVGSSGLSILFNPIIFFVYSVVVEDSRVSPKEVLKMKGAGGDLSAFF